MGKTGSIIKSVDGGNTWSVATPTGATLAGLHFLDGNNGWTVGGGVILHTTDGGATYAPRPTSPSLNSVCFLTNATGIAVGTAGKVLRTTDGGATWNSLAPTGADLNAVYFAGMAVTIALSFGWAFYLPNGLAPFIAILFVLGFFGGNFALFSLWLPAPLLRLIRQAAGIIVGQP